MRVLLRATAPGLAMLTAYPGFARSGSHRDFGPPHEVTSDRDHLEKERARRRSNIAYGVSAGGCAPFLGVRSVGCATS
jgi:hypothetical protein